MKLYRWHLKMISDRFFLVINFFILAILVANRSYFFIESLEDYSYLTLKSNLVSHQKNKKELDDVSTYNYLFAILIMLILLTIVIIIFFFDENMSDNEKRRIS